MERQQTKLAPSKNPYILMPVLLLMWGSLAAVSKLLLGHLDSYQVLFYMYGLAAVVFAGIAGIRGRLSELRRWRAREAGLLLACGVFSFLYDFLYLQSLAIIPAVEASMLNYLFPIFIVLFAIPFHNEKMNAKKLISIAMGFTGTLLLMTKGDIASFHFTNWKGDLLAIGAAVSWGIFTNLVKKNKQEMLLSTTLMTVIAFILSILTLMTSSSFTMPGMTSFYGLLWISISNIVLGFFLYMRALQHSPASLIASFTFFTPFITLAFIALLIGEKLTLLDFAAAALILFSVPMQNIGVLFSKRRRDRSFT